MSADPHDQPPIADYALIGDCHSAALVSTQASIDWCCMPRFDSGSIFARLLDWHRGGHCQIVPTQPYEAHREYLDDTLVLVTTFETRTGEARLYDCFTMRRGGGRDPRRQLLRIVEGVQGTLELDLDLRVRFDYAEVRPWLRHHGDRFYSVIGGNDALVITSDTDLESLNLHDLRARFDLRAGKRVRLSMTWERPEEIDPAPPPGPLPEELDARLDETIKWWRRWVSQRSRPGTIEPEVRRSAIILKALTHAPTGAVVAAVTTSLPEVIGGERNWDYRYSWIRDSQFTVRTLGQTGRDKEADGFRRFVERSAAGSAESLQIMYGVGGERRLTELTLALAGYRGSKPVRIGNAASSQLQLDVYGYLLDLAWRWHHRGASPDDDYWRFLLSLVDAAAARWKEPDCGIWEVRGDRQHFVHSKVMCWVALDRGIELARACLRDAPIEQWEQARHEIVEAIEEHGYDRDRGVFRRAFGTDDLDASLLLLPQFGFVDYTDERMVRTTDAIRSELDEDGFLRRYTAEDGLAGDEGVFIACTFWLAEVLARQGRVADAREVFDRATATANDVGIFAEEYSPSTGELLGNTPQGLSHLSHVAAALALADALDRPARP